MPLPGPPLRKIIRPAAVLPHPGVEDLGVRGIDGQVAGPGLGIDVEDLLPGLAAVERPVDAAVLVRAPEVALGGDVDDVGIDRVDDDAADEAGLGQAHVLPGLAGVLGLVDAVAGGHGIAGRGLARADPDDIGVALRDGHRADRDRRFLVEGGGPVQPGILGLPQPARPDRGVDRRDVRLGDGEVDRPAAHVGRADVAGLELLDHGGVIERLGLRGGGRRLLRLRDRGRSGEKRERDESREDEAEGSGRAHGDLLRGANEPAYTKRNGDTQLNTLIFPFCTEGLSDLGPQASSEAG